MTRRVALALAVALTTVVTFAVVATGQEVGMFGGAGAGEDTSASAHQQLSTPTPTPIMEPDVITEYIYLDEPAAPTPQAGTPGSAFDDGSPSEVSSHDDDDDDWEEEEHEDEHEDDDEHEEEDEHEHESEWDD